MTYFGQPLPYAILGALFLGGALLVSSAIVLTRLMWATGRCNGDEPTPAYLSPRRR